MALPNGYTELPYIESSGTQYINTGVSYANATVVTLDFEFVGMNTANTHQGLYGLYTGFSYSYRLWISGTTAYKWYYRYRNNEYTSTAGWQLNTRYLTVANLGTTQRLSVNGSYVIDTSNSSNTTGNSPMYLFALNNNSSAVCHSMIRLYSCTIVKQGTTVRTFVPAKRDSDSVLGLYDTTNGIFYTNQGTGVFETQVTVSAEADPIGAATFIGTGAYDKGDSVALEATPSTEWTFNNWTLKGYTKLNYIESTGTQCIDTGVKANNNTRLETHMYFVDGDAWLFGSREGALGTVGFGWLRSGAGNFVRYSYGVNYTEVSNLMAGDMYIDANKNVCTYTNGQDTYSITVAQNTFSSTKTLAILGFNGPNGYEFSTSGSKLYYAKIYDNNILIRDLIPVVRHSDSAIGLLDLCEMKFYGSVGTGSFEAGGDYSDFPENIILTGNPLSFVVTEDVSFRANLVSSYIITLNYDGTLGSASYSWQDPVTIQLTAVSNQGAQFIGWYANSVFISSDLIALYYPISDVTIEARFEPIYAVTDTIVGNGQFSFSRGISDQNEVTFGVLSGSNWHFVSYTVNGYEYTVTPITLRLTQNTAVTVTFIEDNKFKIEGISSIPYGTVYVSDEYAYAGDVVSLYARPFPGYNFVNWSDGLLDNPRNITVSTNTSLVANYVKINAFENDSTYQHRCYVKDQHDLTLAPKAFMVAETYDINRDLMTNANTTVDVLDPPDNINNGDILVIYDQRGNTIYSGVIDSIEPIDDEYQERSIKKKRISCSQMQSFYKGNFIYYTDPQSDGYLEHEIAEIMTSYSQGNIHGSTYVDETVAERLGGITIDYVGSTQSKLPTDLDEDGNENMTVRDMEDWIYELYEKYSIVFEFEINFSGTNYCHIKVPNYEELIVGNNIYAIKDMSPLTTIEETNKLIIYAADKTYRATYVAKQNGDIVKVDTASSAEITANRFDITVCEIVYSDDDESDLVASYLPQEMINHQLTFTLLLDNFMYSFDEFHLGMPLHVYHNGDYYDSVFTGYSVSKEENREIKSIEIICGKVRQKLTQLLTLGKL